MGSACARFVLDNAPRRRLICSGWSGSCVIARDKNGNWKHQKTEVSSKPKSRTVIDRSVVVTSPFDPFVAKTRPRKGLRLLRNLSAISATKKQHDRTKRQASPHEGCHGNCLSPTALIRLPTLVKRGKKPLQKAHQQPNSLVAGVASVKKAAKLPLLLAAA
jgi:hypothetical protein